MSQTTASAPATLNSIAFSDDAVDVADPLGFGRPCDRAAGSGLDAFIASSVIRVPVGVDHLGERPAPLRRGLQNRLRDGRVDGRSLPGLRVVNQPDVIVGKDRDGKDFHRLPLLLATAKHHQRIGRELACEFGCREGFAERRRLSCP